MKVARHGEPHTIIVKKDGYLSAQRVVEGKDDHPAQGAAVAQARRGGRGSGQPPPTLKPVQVAATPSPKAAVPSPKLAVPSPKPAVPSPKLSVPSPKPVKHTPKPKKEDTLILTPSF